MQVKFGPSGNSKSFYDQGYSSSVEMPEWLNNLGLNAYEYQCNRGVKIGQKLAAELKFQAEKYNIQLSVHAPYYINPAAEDEVRLTSIDHAIKTLYAASWMGATRIVVHSGACKGKDRAQALNVAMKFFRHLLNEARSLGLDNILICPETMGKINQLGTLEEVLEICKLSENLMPTIDFGHLHARGLGSLNDIDDFRLILDKIENQLGYERLKYMHVHFSKIEFSAAGEKRHWNMDSTLYGPEFYCLAQLIYEKNLKPTIICESRGTMAEDAVLMKQIYNDIVSNNNDK